MAAHNELLPLGVTMPLAAPRRRGVLFGSSVFTLLTMLFLVACGGTLAKPTADDAATIAAANAATPAGTGTARTPGASAAANSASTSGGGRTFGSLLTPAPVRNTATTASTRAAGPTGTAGATSAAGLQPPGTPSGTLSPQSPALDPCTLVTPAQLSKVMGEPFSEFTNDVETPSGTNSRLRGYSSASCTFAATASTQNAVRAVQLGTIRRTPASSPPSGSGTFASITDVWSYIKMQAQGSNGTNPSVLMGVGDEAFAVSDPDNPGDEDVFVRKGDVVLLVIVSGYDMGARDKAVAVATQAADSL